MVKRSIQIKTGFELLHCWPDAPDEVFFLRTLHRHEIYVEVQIEVGHNDRDLEFIMVKHFVEDHIKIMKDKYPRNVSCEMIADLMIEVLREKYGERHIIVRIFEDNENGGIVEYTVDK